MAIVETPDAPEYQQWNQESNKRIQSLYRGDWRCSRAWWDRQCTEIAAFTTECPDEGPHGRAFHLLQRKPWWWQNPFLRKTPPTDQEGFVQQTWKETVIGYSWLWHDEYVTNESRLVQLDGWWSWRSWQHLLRATRSEPVRGSSLGNLDAAIRWPWTIRLEVVLFSTKSDATAKRQQLGYIPREVATSPTASQLIRASLQDQVDKSRVRYVPSRERNQK